MAQEIVVKYTTPAGQEVKLTQSIVQKYIVGSNAQITMPEFKFFSELCQARGLNPFLKEAYCIKYGNEPATIVVSKDVIEQRAESFPSYDGKESGIIVMNRENGEITERNGCFWMRDREELVGGWCRVYRKDRSIPEYMSVSMDEVAQKKRDGSYNTNWSNKPATMIEKVAKVRALRAAFPKDFSGMYIADEMTVPETAHADANTFEAQPISAEFTDISDEPIAVPNDETVDINNI